MILAGGDNPFEDTKKFRYVLDIPGQYVNDHCLTFDGRFWHLFFIQGEIAKSNQVWSRKGNEIHIGHATSSNLINWQVHKPALTVDENLPNQARTYLCSLHY